MSQRDDELDGVTDAEEAALDEGAAIEQGGEVEETVGDLPFDGPLGRDPGVEDEDIDEEDVDPELAEFSEDDEMSSLEDDESLLEELPEDEDELLP